MNILVIGAANEPGKEIVHLVLNAGHEVTAFVRDPANYSIRHQNLFVCQGDIHFPESLSEAVAGQEMIIINADSLHTDDEGMRNVVKAMKENNVNKLIVFFSKKKSFFTQLISKTGMNRKKNQVIPETDVIVESGLAWTLIKTFRLSCLASYILQPSPKAGTLSE